MLYAYPLPTEEEELTQAPNVRLREIELRRIRNTSVCVVLRSFEEESEARLTIGIFRSAIERAKVLVLTFSGAVEQRVEHESFRCYEELRSFSV